MTDCRFSMRHARIFVIVCAAAWVSLVFRQLQVVQESHHPTHEETSDAKHTFTSISHANTETSHHIQSTSSSLNGLPATHHRKSPPASHVECHEPSLPAQSSSSQWMFRSCRIQQLCFDTKKEDFVVIVPSNQYNLSQAHAVALGGINPRWDMGEPGPTKGIDKIRWFPRQVASSSIQDYFQLPTAVVWVPFHSMAGHNVGHLFWDDFYPIFRLLRMFGLLPKKDTMRTLLLWRQKLLSQSLYATCDIRRNKRMQCKKNFLQFVSSMGVDPTSFSTSKDFRWNSTVSSSSGIVCAETGVVGMGMLTDHGGADHGWDPKQISTAPHNLGHGYDLYAFRDYILSNRLGPGVIHSHIPSDTKQRRVVFSLESSKDWDRRLDFQQHMAALQKSAFQSDIEVLPMRLWELSFDDQLKLVVDTDIFITACGGGSMTATFLPRGASLVVFYNPSGGYDYANGSLNQKPARLDWDMLNNAASHVRVHWLPITSGIAEKTVRQSDLEINLFVELIQHELQVLQET